MEKKLGFNEWVSKCEKYSKSKAADTFCATMEHWGYESGRSKFVYTLCLSYTSANKTVMHEDWKVVLKMMDEVLENLDNKICPTCGQPLKN